MRDIKKGLSMVLVFILVFSSISGIQLPTVHAAASDLFISEYIEGSSNNKALEIYNGTGAPIDLAAGGYKIEMYFNGSASAGTTLNLSGTIQNDDVYVIAHSSADAAILAAADLTNGASFYNGDDAVVLKKGTDIIDVIGQVGFDPGSEWGSGLTSTADNTLVREKSIEAGDTDATDAFEPSAEWVGYATNTFSNLGSHTMDGSGGEPELKVKNVSATPDAGQVTAGTEVALFSATEGAAVYYAVYYAAYAPDYSDVHYEVFDEDEPIVVNEPLSIKAYASKNGLEDSDISEFEYSLISKMSIADTKNLGLGTKVIVEGKVTTVPGSFGTKSFYIQDDTGGALIFTSSLSPVPAIGNTVRIEGATAEYNGKFEIVPTKIAIIDEGTTEPAAKAVSLSDVDEENEGALVKLRAVEVIGVTSDTYKSAYITVTDGVNGTTVKLDNRTGQTYDNLTVKAGDYIDVMGVVEQSKASPAEYWVMLRNLEDIGTTDVISLSAARALADDTDVLIQGIVTSKPGSYGQKSYYIQDSTSGALVYTSIVNSLVARGSRLLITGKTDSYNGKFEIVPATIEVLSQEAAEFTPAEIGIADIAEGKEAVLVKLNDVRVQSMVSDSYKSATLIITDGTDSGEVKLDNRTGFTYDDLSIVTGDLVNITGIVEQSSNTAYRVLLRDLNDIAISENDDKVAPVITHTAITDGNINLDLAITAEVTDNMQVSSVKLYYRVKGISEYSRLDMSAASNTYSAAIPKAQLSVSGIEYYIEASDGINTATSPENIASPYEVAISDADIVGPGITNVIPANNAILSDTEIRPAISAAFSDPSGIDTSSVKLLVDGTDITTGALIQENGVSYQTEQDMVLGKHNVSVEVSDTLGNKAEYAWTFTIGEIEYNHYYGQLHAHTGEISDGQGTLDAAYTWARDQGDADFFAVTDHSNWFDNDTANEDITEISQSTSNEWKLMNSKADQYNKDGEFVAIAGFEMTWSGSTGGWGHINTFNTPWFASRSNSSMDLSSYYTKIAADTDSISQLNHPGTTFGDFADFGYYSQGADNVVQLIEVGNGEGPVGGSGYFPSYEYYTRALDKGWHVAPSNNQDNHKAGWITANDARTVVLSSELTRNSIYEAIRSLRVYSTEDKNLELMYKVNGNAMGSTLDAPEKLSVYINVKDKDEGDEIGKVSIIANGGVEVASETFNDNEALWELELDPQYSYYYVRVDQEDQDIAVTAPVWTDEVVPVGMSKVEVSQDPQIINNPIDISATVYNNGKGTLEDVKVEFYKNSIEAGNKIGGDTITAIATGGTGTASIEWTADMIGKYNLYARTTISIDGVDKVLSGSTTATISNPEDVIKVVLDRAHYNAYISGDYAGKDLTLREMFKERKYMLVENNDELTAADLKNAQLLIITDPQGTDKSDTLKKSIFTDAEVAAIKEYTDNGGSLIICSKADYKDGTGEYSNGVQLNKILESVGTNLRVNDDEVVDDVNNGGQAYRLYFNNYTSTKYNLTDNIPEGTTYSFYSGASVVQSVYGANVPIDWLVKGHSTTGTLDSDNQSDNVPVAQGDVNVIGAELLPSGAKIIVAGSIFFSDFETASNDNAYSNKQITSNILDWMIQPKEVELKTIAEIRADDNKDGIPDLLGKRFAAEGRVTAQSEAVTPKNAFFEVIYVQDETGGITVFGVSATPLPLGTKVRVTGIVEQYDGDTELSIENEANDVIVPDGEIILVEPMVISTGDSMLEQNEGWLVKVQGTVTRMTENSLYLNDGTGEARVYVNGYIGDGTGNTEMLGKWDPDIKLGDRVSAIGLASEDTEGHRLRVRNTAEIVRIGSVVTGVTLDKAEAAIKVGSSVTLTATVQPEDAANKNVIWSSADTDIATVVSGVVTGVSAGTALITVTTEDGSHAATCNVTVTNISSSNDDDDEKKSKKPVAQTTTIPSLSTGIPAGVPGQAPTVIVGVNAGAIGVTQTGNSAVVSVQAAALSTAAQQAQQQAVASNSAAMVSISPQLQENVSEVAVQMSGAALAGLAQSGVGLQINTGTASIQLSPEMLGSLPTVGTVNLIIRRVDPESELDNLPEGMRSAGSGIELEFGLGGNNTRGSIIIEVSIGNDVDKDLVGLYYYNEETDELIFVGGRVEENILQGETTHNSKYFVLEYKKLFADTRQDAWYSKYVNSITAKHIMNGYPDNTFKGNSEITRGEFAAALSKVLGLKSSGYKGQFKDVDGMDYYAEAVQSLLDKGIMKGDSNATFSPDASITREEVFAIIGRITGIEAAAEEKSVQSYEDYKALASWAVDGAQKAVSSKLITGENNKLKPKSRLSRFEAAVVLYRLFNK